jgi:ATP-binding protein involved in chromosome partitioning
VPFLGEIPLDLDVRVRSDSGEPVVATAPESRHAALYRDMARLVWAAIEQGGLAKPPPRIVIND